MADISMCMVTNCPLKEKCYRFTANKSLVWQSYFMNTPYDHIRKACDNYWKNY